jgi:hypothetical protein
LDRRIQKGFETDNNKAIQTLLGNFFFSFKMSLPPPKRLASWVTIGAMVVISCRVLLMSDQEMQSAVDKSRQKS